MDKFELWRREFHDHLDNILSEIIKDKEFRQRYLTDEAMEIWIQALTHESYDYNVNYEKLEFLGDSILSAVFIDYIMHAFPELKQSEYSELRRAYTSTEFNPKFTDRLGLAKFVRTNFGGDTPVPRSNIHIKADIFESFLGALYRIGNELILEPIGYADCLNLTRLLYSEIDIDLSETIGHAKMQVEQIFSRFTFEDRKLSQPQETKLNHADGTVEVILKLNQDAINFLLEQGVVLDSEEIARAYGQSYAAAKNKAYKEALAYLAKNGVSTKWAEDLKSRLDFSEDILDPYKDELEEKFKEQGYINIYFHTPKKATSGNRALVQLHGERADGKRDILSSEWSPDVSPHTIAQTRIKLVRKYLGYPISQEKEVERQERIQRPKPRREGIRTQREKEEEREERKGTRETFVRRSKREGVPLKKIREEIEEEKPRTPRRRVGALSREGAEEKPRTPRRRVGALP
mgnify:CR=1 FL=1